MSFLNYNFPDGVEAFSTRICSELPYPVVLANQVHGNSVAIVNQASLSAGEVGDFDALVTNVPGCAIAVKTADCVPILIYDSVHHVVAAVHSGWRGTVAKISLCTLALMADAFGTHPSDVSVAIGPCICYDCFQVGQEVVDAFAKAGFPMDTVCRFDGKPENDTPAGGYHIDLVESNKWLLARAGVCADNISSANVCTYQSPREFFSVRASGRYINGRIYNVIKLPE